MSDLQDALDDAAAAAELRGGRTPSPRGTEVRWAKNDTLEVDRLVIEPGQSAENALLKFLEGAMGGDKELAQALDLDKLSFSLLYDSEGERRLAWIKCPVDRSKIRPHHVREATAEFVEAMGKRRPRKAPAKAKGPTTDDLWFVNDLQLGKGPEAFGGYAATRKRFNWVVDERLPAMTSRVDKIWIPTVGDLTEGCLGSYAHQPYTITLNSAEQFRAALGMLNRIVERALDLAQEVELTGVGSNHDQNTRGQAKDTFTDDWDDRTFMLMDALALGWSKSEDGDRVKITFPEDPLVVGLQVRDTVVAATHGHKVKANGTEAVVKLNNWWKGQIAKRHGAAAAATVLVAAHYHHYYTLWDSGRLLVGLPAMDGGSGYLSDGKGVWSLPGFVTMKIDDHGVADLLQHIWPEDRARAKRELGLIVP